MSRFVYTLAIDEAVEQYMKAKVDGRLSLGRKELRKQYGNLKINLGRRSGKTSACDYMFGELTDHSVTLIKHSHRYHRTRVSESPDALRILILDEPHLLSRTWLKSFMITDYDMIIKVGE